MKNKKWVIKVLVIVLLLGILLLVLYLSNNHNMVNGDVQIHFLKMDNADSFIIKHKDYVMIIDTGEDKDLETLKNKLNELNVTKINRLIITHPDKDHIGNAEYIISNYQVDNIIQNNFEKNSSIQKSFNKKIKTLGLEPIIIEKNYNFYEAGISIHLYATDKDYDSNNSSIVVLIKYGTTRVFLGSDIEDERIIDILPYNLPTCQIVKLPHHGEYGEESINLLNKLMPTDIISTGKISKKILNFYDANYYITIDSEIIVDISQDSYMILGGS